MSRISFHLVKPVICFRLCIPRRTKVGRSVGRSQRPEQVAALSVAVVGLGGAVFDLKSGSGTAHFGEWRDN